MESNCQKAERKRLEVVNTAADVNDLHVEDTFSIST